MPQTCGKFAAHSCGKFAANAFFVCKFLFWHTVLAHNVRRRYAANSCRALFWHTMCAASLQRTVTAHCNGTQCEPQVCSAQLSSTILAHNVRCKFAVHSCRALHCEFVQAWFSNIIWIFPNSVHTCIIEINTGLNKPKLLSLCEKMAPSQVLSPFNWTQSQFTHTLSTHK